MKWLRDPLGIFRPLTSCGRRNGSDDDEEEGGEAEDDKEGMKMSVLRFVKITLRNPVESRRNLTQWFYCSQMLLACLSGVSQEEEQGEQQRFLKVRNTHQYYVAKPGILLEDTP